MATKNQNSKDANKKDVKVVDSLRDEMELVNAATIELQKLKRQLRQTRSDLSSAKVTNRKTIQRQNKGIELLEKERDNCQCKLVAIKENQRPPQAVNKLIEKYQYTLQQLEYARKELAAVNEELKERKNRRPNKHRRFQQHSDVGKKPSQDKVDQIMLQYNKILAKNTQLRESLQALMKIKEEFLRNFKLLQNERNYIRSFVDRLYEENTTLFQQREEFRLKLNLLRERLETTRIQGQRDLREYRRLLNNDEKLNVFLEQKNHERPCLELTSRVNSQQIGDDQMTQKVVEEWRDTFAIQVGHSNFEEIVESYQHNLEQGYVLYGLIAQKNNEIDRLEDEMAELEQRIEHQRLRNNQQVTDSSSRNEDATGASNTSPSSRSEQESTVLIMFLSKLQLILGAMDLKLQFTEKAYRPSATVAPEVQGAMSSCEQLLERTAHLVSIVTNIDKQQFGKSNRTRVAGGESNTGARFSASHSSNSSISSSTT